MRGLVLVDLDNVPSMTAVIDEALAFAQRNRNPFAGSAAVVCIAANTFKVYEEKLRSHELREEGSRLAEAFGASCDRVEIAVTLTMPQTADIALQRLAKEAPSAGAAGSYDYAVVLTKDVGLQRAFQRLYEGLRWVEVKLSRGKAWTSSERAGTARRTGPPPPSIALANAPTASGHFTIVVEDDATAAWASNQRVDVGPEQDLFQIALRLDRDPWLLTQTGPTNTSLRGIARLDALLVQQSITFGPVSKMDGLELRGSEQLPRHASTPRAATVGIGAVRFLSANATVPCKLPLAMLQDGVHYEINPNGVDIDFALSHLRYVEPIGSAVEVTLAQERDSVVARVEGGTSVEAWWVRHTETKSEKRVAFPGAVSAPVKATAFLMRSPADHRNDRVCLGAGVKRGAQVVARSNIARGHIGQGSTQGSVPVAIYAIRNNIASGDLLTVGPIQEASLPKGLEDLRLLPLVVPL